MCTICTDEIKDDFCAAPCGHTFHFLCLSEWLKVQKNCPQCREKCLPRNVIKLYTNSNDLTTAELDSLDPQEMREKLALQDNLMVHKDQALVEARTELSSIQKEMKAWQSQHKEMHKKLKGEKTVNEVLRRQLCSMSADLDVAKVDREELESVKVKLTTLEGMEKVLAGSKEEAEAVIANQTSISNLATFFVALKNDYEVLKGKRAVLLKDKVKLTREVNFLSKQLQTRENEIVVLEIDVHSAEEERKTLQKKVELLQGAIDSPGSRHVLKRILESPMPDRLANPKPNLGASPLLAGSRGGPVGGNQDSEIRGPPRVIVAGIKRAHRSKENIVMPVKMFKSDRPPPSYPRTGPSSLKPFSSNVLKSGLKFAPRKMDHFYKNH